MANTDFLVGCYLCYCLYLDVSFGDKNGSVLENRASKIASDLDSAKAADAEAKSTFESYEKALADARNEAAAQAAAAMAEAKANAQAAEEPYQKLGTKIKKAGQASRYAVRSYGKS